MKAIINLLGALIVGGLIGCTIDPPSGVPGPSMGSLTVTKYVAIGNSLAAGYQSNGLYQSAQGYSYPNIIADQMKVAGASLGQFEQPWYSDPGNADPATGKAARYEIISLTGPVIGPKGLTAGAPTNTALARPYDNLGVPGAVIFDFLDTTSITVKAGAPRNNPFFSLVMRNQAAFGKRLLDQAKALNPGIVSFWLGNNDVLGYATSGGVSSTTLQPTTPTATSTFTALYNQAIDSLKANLPNAKLVLATIPDVTTIPFFTTIGPKVGALLGGAKFYFQKNNYTVDS
ncbi:MAG: hypothetical protein HY966_03800, partial [Ignavibacteriales bacterium]|nr:hypothetical protein [Ignavibacteriales bacterium]